MTSYVMSTLLLNWSYSFLVLKNQGFGKYAGVGYGAFITKIIERSGKDRKEFASALAVTQETLSRWENDHMVPKKYRLEQMLELVGLTLDKCLCMPEEIVLTPDKLRPMVQQLVEEAMKAERSPPGKIHGDRMKGRRRA